MESLEQLLAQIVGTVNVITDRELTASYERDWTGRYGSAARMVVRPADTDEVARVVATCAEQGVAIVPQGGNTGLVGGSVPRDGEVVLSTRRLSGIGEIDLVTGQVTVGAGTTLAAVQAAAAAAGEDTTLDFAARDSCTLGGVVACDAGGARALRHGTARAHVAGLEAVLADGSVISRLAGLTKDNAGYALPSMLIGSEGTLGIITRVRWRLTPRLTARVAALVPVASVAAAADLLRSLRIHAPSLESCDFVLERGLEMVLSHQRRRSPFPRSAPVYVLAECAATSDPIDELNAALEEVGAGEAVVADDTAGRARLWSLREGLTEAINQTGIPHKLDVGVPLSELDRFLSEVAELDHEARFILFGHLGDGNVHVNVLGPAPDDERIDDMVLDLALACNGTISSEHGVGVAKARWLERARGPAEFAAMCATKRAFDPHNLLNPGAVIPIVA